LTALITGRSAGSDPDNPGMTVVVTPTVRQILPLPTSSAAQWDWAPGVDGQAEKRP